MRHTQRSRFGQFVVSGMLGALLLSLPVPAPLSAQVSATAILDHIRVSGQRAIDFHAVTLPETVYVGQQATYQVAVMLSQDAKSRLRRNPEFLPPELRGLLAYELSTPVRVPWRRYGELEYESHIFQRALFPVAAGSLVVPAPQLSYALPQSASYFSREERFVVKAESAVLVVRALPVDDRPVDFNGAVGVFRSTVKLDTSTARVGDPVVLTLRVQGIGNVKLLPRPVVEVDWASVVAGTERIEVDSSGPLVRGSKEFDWILTPTRDGRVILPEFRYSYFDPYQQHYAVATTVGNELTIRPGTLVAVEEDDGTALMPLRLTELPPKNMSSWFGDASLSALGWLALLLAIAAPWPAAWLLLQNRMHQGQRNSSSTTSPVRVVRDAPVETGPRERARASRRRLLDALAKRFDETPHMLISRRHVIRVLRRGGVTRPTTQAVIALLKQLDETGFAEAGTAGTAPTVDALSGGDSAERTIDDVLRKINHEALAPGRQIRVRRIGMMILALAIGMPVGAAAPVAAQAPVPTSPVDSVANANANANAAPSASVLAQLARDAYQRRAFTEAESRFAALARTYPNDPNLLANWGTSAWALGDTVNAVIAWQRAARLQPFALDLQEKVSVLPAGARGGIADIPMVPVTALSVLALTAWLLGWALLAWQAWRPSSLPHGTRSVAVLLLVLAVASIGGARWGIRTLSSDGLSVVTRPETLRIAPGVDADAMGGVATGDVVRVIEARDPWLRVVHADGRRGWLPQVRVRALHDPQVTR